MTENNLENQDFAENDMDTLSAQKAINVMDKCEIIAIDRTWVDLSPTENTSLLHAGSCIISMVQENGKSGFCAKMTWIPIWAKGDGYAKK